MTLARQRRPASADLVSIVAVYLCMILALQGFAAARALGAGPLHRHAGPAGAESVAALVFSHHDHKHQNNERHHHAHGDTSVQHSAGPEETVDDAAFALTAALALLALTAGVMRQRADPRRHVWRAAPVWACCSVFTRLLYKPPRPT